MFSSCLPGPILPWFSSILALPSHFPLLVPPPLPTSECRCAPGLSPVFSPLLSHAEPILASNPDDSQRMTLPPQPFPPEVRPSHPTAGLKGPLGSPKGSSNLSQPKLPHCSTCHHHPSISSGGKPGSYPCLSFSHPHIQSLNKSYGIYFQSVSQIGHFSSAPLPPPASSCHPLSPGLLL